MKDKIIDILHKYSEELNVSSVTIDYEDWLWEGEFEKVANEIIELVNRPKYYKIRHKPTGLYFTPSRGNGNFSIKGKLYEKKPNLKVIIGNWVKVIIKKISNEKLNDRQQKLVDFFNIKKDNNSYNNSYWIDKDYKTCPEDWEIIEV